MMEQQDMSIWQYIEVLERRNKTWFFSNSNTKEKINALTKIAVGGHPKLIYRLTGFLKDSNKEIRETTCKVIIHLFKKIDSKRNYYDTLKYCRISESDIAFYKATFPAEQYVELLAIGSLNGNGHVREKAVEELAQAKNPGAIQFLIYRLADWVPPVRQTALKGINNYKSEKYIDSLIENLPIFEWLQRVERTDLSGIYLDVIDFIASANRGYIITRFKKYPDKHRLLLARHISNSLTDNPDELKLFLTDKHFLIRNLAIEHLGRLRQCEIEQLLDDRSARVRLQTLYRLKGQKGFDVNVKKYLADNSASIRQFARFTLKLSNINFADFYNQNLQEGNQIVGSLNGLAEIEAKQYSEAVKKYLNDKTIKVRKNAFLALSILDKENAYEFALKSLDSSYAGLRNIIIDYLQLFPRQEVIEKARVIYATGDYELRKSMLNLFNKLGGWTAIPDLMLGTIDEDENIRQLALTYLQTWRARAVGLFTTPKQEEIERARQAFYRANKEHENKQYFKTNPIAGLDFYLK